MTLRTFAIVASAYGRGFSGSHRAKQRRDVSRLDVSEQHVAQAWLHVEPVAHLGVLRVALGPAPGGHQRVE
jgi:hypothetical protein